MPASNQHLDKAQQNRILEAELTNHNLDPNFEWRTVLSFYDLLHQMDAYLDYYGARRKKHPRSHRQRAEFLQAAGIPNQIYEDYLLAYRLSTEARYEINSINLENYEHYKNEIYNALVTWISRQLHGRITPLRRRARTKQKK